MASSFGCDAFHGWELWPWTKEDWALLSFRSCLGSSQNLWPKRGPTTKCYPQQFLPWHLQDQSWHQHQPSLWSRYQETLHFTGRLILNLSSLHLRGLFVSTNLDLSCLPPMLLLFQCFFYGFLVSNIYKSSLVAHLTSPSYSITVSLGDKYTKSEISGWHAGRACGIWRLQLGHC